MVDVEKENTQNSLDNKRWNGLKDVKFRGESTKSPKVLDAERQQRKIEVCLLDRDMRRMNEHDVEISAEQENRFLDELASGKISKREQSLLLRTIQTPVHQFGKHRVLSEIVQDKHQSKILAIMTGRKSDEYDTITANTIIGFTNQFPTPMEFEEREEKFLQSVQEHNSEAKYQEYIEAMNAFKHNVYGKRLEYWQQLKILQAKAYNKKAQENNGSYFRREKMENLVRSCGVAMKSKSEVVNNEPGVSEDAYVVDERHGVFAVFDGVGGEENGHNTSECAAQTLRKICGEAEVGGDNLVSVLQTIQKEIIGQKVMGRPMGATTAVITKLEEDEYGKKISFASVGDSRIYLVHDQQIRQLNHDDAVTPELLDERGIFDPSRRARLLAHGITNSLRVPAAELDTTKNPAKVYCSAGNLGVERVESGDRLILCSDGITGDTEKDFLYPDELMRILKDNSDDQVAANRLVQSARKRDDRTVIVYTVG